jgi:hypothetical protein
MSMNHAPHVAYDPDIPPARIGGAAATGHSTDRPRRTETRAVSSLRVDPSGDTKVAVHTYGATRRVGLTARCAVRLTSPRGAYPRMRAAGRTSGR